MADVDWQAQWITPELSRYASKALPVFRRGIALDKPIARAVAHLCGLGHHELQINGSKAGKDVLEPAWTNYARTCMFVSHDVTSLLRAGANEIRVLLGNGMYNVTGGRYAKFKGSFGPLKLIAQIEIEFADGTRETLVTDESWQVAPGPITFSCIYGGEDYDARLQHIPESAWQPVAITYAPGWRLVPQISPPIRVMRTYKPVKVTNLPDGSRVYDFGQNFAGRMKFSVRGGAGETVKCIPAELLDENGAPNQRPVGRPVSYSYTCKGDGVETWHPRFSYYGFRYVQVIGPEPIEIEGHFHHCAARAIGEFECSSELLNRIHTLINFAILSNMQHVLTDCPHREKLGWLEQSHLMAEALLYGYDVASYYRKISADMRDAQHADGCVPVIAPQYTLFLKPWEIFNDSPEWGSAAVINPWKVYQFTGDARILAENYESMKRYVEYLAGRSEAGIIAYGLGDWYDVGPGGPGFSKLTTLGLTATAIYFADLTIMSRVAKLLGRADHSQHFAAQAAAVRKAFNDRFFDPATGRYDTGSQTSSAMPLALGLVDETHRDRVLKALIDDIRSRGNQLTAGDIGFRFVIEALCDAGRSDVVFDMLTRGDGPGYAYQLAQGATTLTEAWDADPNVSQNHLMLGHAEIWFYRYLAGIRIDMSRQDPERISIKPVVVGDLTWARASYESVMGKIVSRWDREGDRVRLQVEVPPGASARVYAPGADTARDVGPGLHSFESTITPSAAR